MTIVPVLGARHHAWAIHVLDLRRRHRVAARRHGPRDVRVPELTTQIGRRDEAIVTHLLHLR